LGEKRVQVFKKAKRVKWGGDEKRTVNGETISYLLQEDFHNREAHHMETKNLGIERGVMDDDDLSLGQPPRQGPEPDSVKMRGNPQRGRINVSSLEPKAKEGSTEKRARTVRGHYTARHMLDATCF